MSIKQEWEYRYTEGLTGWDRGAPSPALDLMLNHTGLKSGKLLVPGCGRGHEVVELARRGFDVTALDIAPSAVLHLNQMLVQNVLQAKVLEVDMLNWRSGHLFDAIYEQTSLCALNPEIWPDYEKQLYNWLKPGGKILALWMQTFSAGGPPYHCDPEVLKNIFVAEKWDWSEHLDKVEHYSDKHEVAYILTKKSL